MGAKPRRPEPPIRITQELGYRAESFAIEIDVDRLSVRVRHDDVSSDARVASDVDELIEVYAAAFRDVTEPRGGASEFYDLWNREVALLDLRAEIDRARRRRALAARLPARDRSRWHHMRAAAHAAIRAADLGSPELAAVAERYDVDVSADALCASFVHVIEIERRTPERRPIALGLSKIGGDAHLPPSLRWPDDREYYLFAQLNVAQLKPHDVVDALPSSGLFYYFIDDTAHGRLLYANSPAHALVATPRPGRWPVPDYMRWLVDHELELEFRSNHYFDQGTDTHAIPNLLEALPADLRDELDRLSGNRAGHVANCKAGDRVLGGEPPDWQSEGEFLHEPLFCQFSAFDGNLFVAVNEDELRAGFTTDAQCTYRGT